MQKSTITRYLIILCCLLSQVNIIVAQSSSIKEQINAIKLNDVYLYGEAKHKIEDLAILHAKKDLVNTVNALRAEMGLSSVEEANIEGLYKKLSYQRGELIYVFIYLNKEHVLNNMSSTSSNDTATEEVDIDPSRLFIDNSINEQYANEILQNIIERQMIENVYGYLQQAKEDNKVEKFAKARNLAEIPDNAFVIIYNRTYKVVTVLTKKVNDKRINVKTNKPDLITNYSGHGAIWYINK